jgi:hypothetical protein
VSLARTTMKTYKASRTFEAAIKRDCEWFQSNPAKANLRRKVIGRELPRNLRGLGITEVVIERAGPAKFVRTFFNAQGRPVFGGYDLYDHQIVSSAPDHPITVRHDGKTVQEVFVNRTDVALIDREWLKQHPGESEFKRLSTEDEIGPNLAPGTDIARFVAVTTVRQLVPGVRERIVSHIREFRKPE